jgi:flagellar basal body-associated protein FliL
MDAANNSLIILLNCVAGLFAAAVVVDTFWHAMKGQGQACRRCGHLQQMSSFRVYGSCPNCGE